MAEPSSSVSSASSSAPPSASSSSSSAAAAAAAADSYIGSLISLTSKSEIRYEGVLFSINPQESTIGLQRVRSYGSEGRKKDGPQIPPSDKIYEYILFRGSDIKDLQVKSSPPAHTMPQVHNDPAIIQSQYAMAPSALTSSALVGGGPLMDQGSYARHSTLARPPFPDAVGSYQTGAHLGTWGSTPAPTNVKEASLPSSMYWPGYAGASSGLPQIQQQSAPFQSPMALPVSQAQQNLASQMQQSLLQHPEVHTQLNTNMPTLLGRAAPLGFSSNITSPHLPNPASGDVPSLMSDNAFLLSHSSSALPPNLPTISPFSSSNQDANTIGNPVTNKVGPNPASNMSVPSLPYSSSSILGPASGPLLTVPPALLTPGQLTQSGSSSYSIQNTGTEPKVREPLLTSSSKLSSLVSALPQAPLLPLPRHSQQLGESVQLYSGNVDLEKDRGHAAQSSAPPFTEEFDFTAMNEKFKKDEVWGSLGKATDRGKSDVTEDHPNSGTVENVGIYDNAPKLDTKPVYNKDDFFDTLSCNSLNRGGWNGRTRFSERMKLDTETFGNFPQRPPLGRGNRGGDGNFRGIYNRGRGYGYYGGRGRDGHPTY